MIICIQGLLTPADLSDITHAMAESVFTDGKLTAGWHARQVKNNLQAAPNQKLLQTMAARVEAALMAHDVFRLAARPRQLLPLLFSRYTEGMSYGSHVDAAFMNGVRTDLSFTVFLSQPEECEGGELIIDLPHGEQHFKLAAGDMVVYPSTTLHRVAPVVSGQRLACVGWVQSMVRRDDQRELLFDLETAQRAVFAKEGKSHNFDLLSKSVSNLLRMWAE